MINEIVSVIEESARITTSVKSQYGLFIYSFVLAVGLSWIGFDALKGEIWGILLTFGILVFSLLILGFSA